MRHTQLQCIVFRKKENQFEFLVMKRIPKKGGFWQPPCGGMEKEDASLIDAAFRELKEEAAITKNDVIKVIENVHYFEVDKHYLTGEPIPTIKEYVFGMEVNHNFEVNMESNIYPEHEEFRWVSITKALELLKWEDNKEGFRKLNLLLNNQFTKNNSQTPSPSDN